jgi:hypothetical protein
MASIFETQPGGFYLGPDGLTPHDAWNRPVEEGVVVFDPPMEVKEGAVIGGMVDTPAPGSDQWRLARARQAAQLEKIEKQQEALAKQAEKLREQVMVPFDAGALASMLSSLSHAATPQSAGGGAPELTRADHVEAGERWAEQREAQVERESENTLATSTGTGEPKKLDKSGQTQGEANMDEPKQEKKGKSKE